LESSAFAVLKQQRPQPQHAWKILNQVQDDFAGVPDDFVDVPGDTG